jgi:hypothetical protein
MKFKFFILAGMILSGYAQAITCTAERSQYGKSTQPETIALKENAVYERLNPGKTQYMAADKGLPYSFDITIDNSNSDITAIIRQHSTTAEGKPFTQTGGSGSFDSRGLFEHGMVVNFPDSTSDTIRLTCKK